MLWPTFADSGSFYYASCSYCKGLRGWLEAGVEWWIEWQGVRVFRCSIEQFTEITEKWVERGQFYVRKSSSLLSVLQLPWDNISGTAIQLLEQGQSIVAV